MMSSNYIKIANDSRKKVLEMVWKAQTSHIGSNFSCADIAAVLFEKADLEKDKVIFSAGWKAAILYYHLWRKGIINQEELDSYCQPGSKFIGLAEPILPEVPFAGGSMGMGLPAAVGYALSKKMKGEDGNVYCLMSDGEMQIGTTWEAAMLAAHYQLNNLIVFCDYNGFQAMGQTSHILGIEPLIDKWLAFGWKVMEVYGHDYKALDDIWEIDFTGMRISGAAPVPMGSVGLPGDVASEDLKYKPMMVVAHTIKGKGVSFMEHNNLYHYKQLSDDEYQRALIELNKNG